MYRHFAIVVTAITVSACGGGSSSVSEVPGFANCSAGGIWRAADSTVAIIDDSSGPTVGNRVHLLQPDGSQLVGILHGVGNPTDDSQCFLDNHKSWLYVALAVGQVLPDGSLRAEGRVDGEWVRRSGDLPLRGTLDTSVGGSLAVDFVGTYDPVHSRPTTTAMLAGTYLLSDGSGDQVVTVDAGGQVFSQNSRTGCVMTGTLVSPDRNYNIFRATFIYSSCQGNLSVLNGYSTTGLAAFDDRNSPAVLLLALDTEAPLQHYSTVMMLDRS